MRTGGGGGGLFEYNVNLVRPRMVTQMVVVFCGITILLALVNLVLHLCFKALRA